MRASRLVHLIMLLQRRGKTTARELARELEVSVRTVYRDLEALSGIGVPVWTESGPGGGVDLLDGWQTRLTGLTATEAQALGLAGVPEVAAQLGLGAVLLAAQAKVDAALPPELRQRSIRLRERFLVDVPGWFAEPADVAWLADLSAAVWDGRQIDVSYTRRDRTVVRRLHPLGLVVQGATWYLVATSEQERGTSAPRTYRVDRIRGVDRLDAPARRPDHFDLSAHWRASRAAFDRALRPMPVTARLPAPALPTLRHVVTPGAFEEAESSAVADGDDHVRVVFGAESVDVAAHELLRLAGVIEVLDPPALRARLHEAGCGLARQHEHAVSDRAG